MKKILVTTDFSANSKVGIRFALQLASQTGAELVFYHAIEIMKPTSWSDSKFRHFATERLRENHKILQKFVNKVHIESQAQNLKFKYICEIGANVRDMILRQSVKQHVSAICMSTRGAGGIAKLMGTVTSAIIRTSKKPVIVVPKGFRVRPIRRIYFACDFANPGPEIRKVKSFAVHLQARTAAYHYDYLLHVPENRQKLERKALKFGNPEFTFNFVRREIEHPLTMYFRMDIKKSRADLAILFTKLSGNWLDRLLAPGESAQLSFHSSVPLLVFRKKV